MTMRTTEGQAATGFRIAPAGPYLLRDYSQDDLTELTELRGLLEELITGPRKFLIPGSMNRLMIQWHADVHRAIQARTPECGPPASPSSTGNSTTR